jgi:hypothetical protein
MESGQFVTPRRATSRRLLHLSPDRRKYRLSMGIL